MNTTISKQTFKLFQHRLRLCFSSIHQRPLVEKHPLVENKYLKQLNGKWAEAVEQLDGTFIEFYKTKPPEAIFEMDDWSRCWKQTNKDAKSTYDQLTIDFKHSIKNHLYWYVSKDGSEPQLYGGCALRSIPYLPVMISLAPINV